MQQHLDKLGPALARFAAGEAAQDDIAASFSAAMQAAQALHDEQDSGWHTNFTATYPEIIGERLKDLRARSGWTQARLADAMVAIGFEWLRVTVAQVEAGTRRMSFEELLAMAALFGVPSIELLIPNDDRYLQMPTNNAVRPEAVSELMLGRGGKVGKGGLDWITPAEVWNHEPIERPASALWMNGRSER